MTRQKARVWARTKDTVGQGAMNPTPTKEGFIAECHNDDNKEDYAGSGSKDDVAIGEFEKRIVNLDELVNLY